jgi:hypothetical protein
MTHEHTFQPIITVATDDDGSNPRLTGIDWGDSYVATHDEALPYPDDLIVEYPGSCPSSEAACAFVDRLLLIRRIYHDLMLLEEENHRDHQ